ncbi:bacteriohemerythrin [Ottowia testudinis]|uniref:Hemerythrin domain-containing protein n=1 Tax=Ottowia testudinis TaxID=2816950 RepID=A0A975CIR6_9BURK|nr:hemerythrin domain-containing protein [Ottowia testudinis]QTD44158.1 hemerythrin domain-containing protein [Ottowia testudinis]
MPTLLWSDDFALGVTEMDATHQEFVALLADASRAADADLPTCWQALVEHTAQHFAREDAYMLATRFAATNCHTTHHAMVLNVMRQGLAMGQQGDLAPMRQMARELATWFPQHADTMDAALALHLQRVGFDPATGAVTHASALPAEAIHGCGGGSCSPAEEPQPAAAAA